MHPESQITENFVVKDELCYVFNEMLRKRST